MLRRCGTGCGSPACRSILPLVLSQLPYQTNALCLFASERIFLFCLFSLLLLRQNADGDQARRGKRSRLRHGQEGREWNAWLYLLARRWRSLKRELGRSGR